MPKKKTKTQLKNKLDKLWRTVGKENAVCEICATLPEAERINYSILSPHHIIGRMSLATRWDKKNLIWLCPTHHTFGTFSAHNNPIWFMDWLAKNKPEQYAYVVDHKHDIRKWTIQELEELVKELEKIGEA